MSEHKSCATCKCFNRTSYAGHPPVPANLGWCQARAPVLVPVGANGQAGTWPLVGHEDYCEHDYVQGEPRKPPMVWRVDWCESERWWGINEDGYMLCVSPEIAKAYIAGVVATMPRETPDAYSYPERGRWVVADKDVHDEVQKAGVVRRFG